MVDEDDARALASYRIPDLFRFAAVSWIALGFVCVLTTALAGAAEGPAVLGFGLIFVAPVSWYLYRVLRMCHRLDLERGVVRWRSSVRRGVLQLEDLRAIRPSELDNSAVFETTRGPSLLVKVRRGFAEFTAAVQAEAPQVSVRTGEYARFADGLPGPNSFRSGT